MNMLKLILLGTLSFTLLNCGSVEKTELTKTDVQKRKVGGDRTDYCEEFGWYDDGVCDDFCVNDDPECSGNCLAQPICQQGYVEVPSCDVDGRPDGSAALECFKNTMCGTTIYCQLKEVNCLSIAPACPDGSAPLNGPCPADASCTVIDDGCTQIVCLVGNEESCGGLALNIQCSDNEFCNYELADSCGSADAQGICEVKPTACTEEYAPVCGCDGRTYGNECSANSAGMSIVSIGECPVIACRSNDDCTAGQGCVDGTCQRQTSCGGRAGDTCAADEFCDYRIGDFCGAADAQGVCKNLPTFCGEIYQPVCGCDGQSYGNSCEANAAGTSVVAEGECATTCVSDDECSNRELCIDGTCEKTKQVACGGSDPNSVRCGVGEFCLIAPQDLCGAADAPGVCTTQPMNCSAIYAPVCGCDNVTYGNECTAWANGASIAATGVCQP